MKKIFLLMSAILMSAVSVNAVDWQSVDTDIPNLNLFIDKDSIKPLNSQECIYAIKYSVNGKPEQVAYIKSDFANKKIGVIQSGDYSQDTYRPKAVFSDYHVFMKALRGDSLLAFADEYTHNIAFANVEQTQKQDFFACFRSKMTKTDSIDNTNVIQSEDNTIYTLQQKDCGAKTVEEYVACVSQDLYKLWTPPKSGRHAQAIVIVQIAPDGSLLNYRFAQKSGDETTDRSIMGAIEQNVLYPKFPESEKSAEFLNLQFVFEYKLFRKSVM